MGCSSNKRPAENIRIFNQSPLIVKKLEDFKLATTNFVFYKTNSILEDYEMGKKLGSGSFGSVRVGIHRSTRQHRAVKTIKVSSFDQDPDYKSKFFHEVSMLKGMDHPNIMRIYEFYEEPHHYHIVTELVDGGQLFDFLVENRRLTEPIASHFLQQILTGVAYIHSKGIVHRDLKPENLILKENSADSSLKLIDFGTSALLSNSKKLSQKLGTAYYIAPEILYGEYDEKCDIWSCGVILYILLCGVPPFIGEDTQAILQQVAYGAFSLSGKLWKNVSSEAKSLVQQLLEFDPNSRPTALDALQHTWFHKSSESTGDLESFANLKKFRAGVKLQQAVMTFIVAQLAIQEETEELAGAFTQLDVNKDGHLSKEELLDGYRAILHCKLDVEGVMNEVDTDGNGYIEYSEFLVAAVKREVIASKQNLENAFKLFDTDGDGKISSEELRGLLGTEVISADKTWADLISQVDQDGDGKINLCEFKEMVLKVF